MELKRLRIQNYKSLKQPQDIDVSEPLITLIGKNGSGKTNVLDGIFTIFDGRTVNERTEIDFRFYIELSDKDISEYKDTLAFDNKDRMIEAYSSSEKHGLGINIDRIKSSFLNELLSETEESVYSISKELKEELEAFNRVIKELSEDKPEYSKFTVDVDFSEEDIVNSTNYGWLFSNFSREIEELVKKVKEIIGERKKGDELALSYQFLGTHIFMRKHYNFTLRYSRPKLTRFEQKHITIDEDAIRVEIDKINRNTTKHRERIDGLYKKLEHKLNVLGSVIDQQYEVEDKADDRFELVLQKIISICNPKIYYLRNENSQLFFKNQQSWNSFYRSIDERTILETFIKYKYTTIEQNELKKQIEEKKLSAEEIKRLSFDLESFINDNMPLYEKEMIKKIKVSEDLSFSIIERSGDVVPFSNTNSGRRWFYTYFFVKGCLQPGDILLMDEPANNLHPEAQIDIRKEIEEISKKNKVIMTTHSPYMISPNSFVYYVEMTDDGTNLVSMDNIGIQQIAKNLGIFDRETVIGDILINNELLSFKEIGKRIKDLLKKNSITQQSVADTYNTDLRAITRKLAGEHLTFNDVEWFCRTYNFKPIELLFRTRLG
jgi:ABC-type cobalamin/Fe3+-siderophores transport system ATPase subunit